MPSSQSNYKQQLMTLPVNSLETNPFQPRETIQSEEIVELSNSIKTHGVIEPLVVAKTPAGYQIIAGERRWRAAKMAGLEEVPASVIVTTPRQMLELALVENVQRQDLHAIERAKGFQQLIREFDLSVKEIAERVGKSQSYVSNSLRLLGLPDLVKDGVIEGEISEGHARALASLEDERAQIQTYKEIVEKHASVRGAEELVRKKKEKVDDLPDYLKRPSSQKKTKKIKLLLTTLKKHCKNPVSITLRQSSMQSRLSITLKGTERQIEKDLNLILDRLNK